MTGSDVEVGGAGVWHLLHPQPRSYPHSPEHRARLVSLLTVARLPVTAGKMLKNSAMLPGSISGQSGSLRTSGLPY